MKNLKKRKTPLQKEFPEPKKKANFDIQIISNADNEIQDIFWSTSPTSQLKHFIERGQLTDCLNLLESRGYSSESALFLLTYLQSGRGVA